MIRGLFLRRGLSLLAFSVACNFLRGWWGGELGGGDLWGKWGFLNGLAWACELLSTPTDFMFHGPSRFVASFHHVASTEKRK
jgi:hypothetical protein